MGGEAGDRGKKGSHRWREASGVRDQNPKPEPHLETAVRTNPDITTGLVFFIPGQLLQATWISSTRRQNHHPESEKSSGSVRKRLH